MANFSIDKGEKFRIVIDGNVASGKSALMSYLETADPNIETHIEPVPEWQNVEGENLMATYFSDRKRYSFIFQEYITITMFEVHNRTQTKPMFIMERSAFSGRRVFMNVLFQTEMLESLELKCFDRFFNLLLSVNRPTIDLIVYLRSSPEVCYKRMCNRNRESEATYHDLKYLRSAHCFYEDWLGNSDNWSFHGNAPVLTLDGDKDLSDDPKLHINMTSQIFQALANITKSKNVSSSDHCEVSDFTTCSK